MQHISPRLQSGARDEHGLGRVRGREVRSGFREGIEEEDWWTGAGGSGAMHPMLRGGAVCGVPLFTNALCWRCAP